MTDLHESMSRLLDGAPPVPMITDQIIADARRTQRRRRCAAGMAVVGAVAITVAGVSVAAAGGHNGRGDAQIVTPADSPSSAPSTDPTPMAISIVDTTSGAIRTEVPRCPSGQLPNLKVDHDQSVNPDKALHALSPSAYKAIGYGEPSKDYQPGAHFLVDGGAPPADSVWLLAWNAAGPAQLSVLSTNMGAAAVGDPFGASGFNATYIGCLPNPN
jgi:hypothetical protein